MFAIIFLCLYCSDYLYMTWMTCMCVLFWNNGQIKTNSSSLSLLHKQRLSKMLRCRRDRWRPQKMPFQLCVTCKADWTSILQCLLYGHPMEVNIHVHFVPEYNYENTCVMISLGTESIKYFSPSKSYLRNTPCLVAYPKWLPKRTEPTPANPNLIQLQ